MKILIKSIKNYFDLSLKAKDATLRDTTNRGMERGVSTQHKKNNIWLVGIYAATILGVFCKYVFEILTKPEGILPTENIEQRLIISLIIATVIFPAIYKNARFDSYNPNLLQLFISFQNGFFWQTIIGEINQH